MARLEAVPFPVVAANPVVAENLAVAVIPVVAVIPAAATNQRIEADDSRRDDLLNPCFDRVAHFAQAAFEEMVGAFDDG